jgi:hypothetical protein
MDDKIRPALDIKIDIPNNKYDEYIMRIMRQYLGLQPDDMSQDAHINSLPPIVLLDTMMEQEDDVFGCSEKYVKWISDLFHINIINATDDKYVCTKRMEDLTVVLPIYACRQAGIEPNDKVDIFYNNGSIIIKKGT